MQMVPELVVAMLSCARLGLIHNIIFGGFNYNSIADRINDSQSKLIITQNIGVRGNKFNIPMYENCKEALSLTQTIEKIIVFERIYNNKLHNDIMNDNKCIFWHDLIFDQSNVCDYEIMDSEDPLFIL